jgi:hypothetical protein
MAFDLRRWFFYCLLHSPLLSIVGFRKRDFSIRNTNNGSELRKCGLRKPAS